MSKELTKSLLPHRSVDHEVELVAGVKPSARGTYRMAPPELSELRNQLNDLPGGEDEPCLVSTTLSSTKNGKFLSALQLNKGAKHEK